MYSLNIQKMQNTPNLANPKAHGKRVRFHDEREGQIYMRALTRSGRGAEAGYESERAATLHPTKGIRSRNMDILHRHGELLRATAERRRV